MTDTSEQQKQETALWTKCAIQQMIVSDDLVESFNNLPELMKEALLKQYLEFALGLVGSSSPVSSVLKPTHFRVVDSDSYWWNHAIKAYEDKFYNETY